MKEKLYTIPVNEAFDAKDECPFCNAERALEQDTVDFVLGSCASYMESDFRSITDEQGFCRDHFKKLFEYGNALGNAWILKTHYMRLRKEYEEQMKRFAPGRISFTDRLMKKSATGNTMTEWLEENDRSCYACRHIREIFDRYIDTFFVLFTTDPAFRDKIKESKGFCLHHMKMLCLKADCTLKEKDLADFYNLILPLEKDNLDRLQEDIDWMVEKFDYRNEAADWRNSKDAVQRCMQKLKGGYPADKPFEKDKKR